MSDFFTGIFAFLGAFFVFGTLWFWIVSAAFFGLMVYWTEDDSNFLAGIGLTAFIWTMATVNDFSVFANPWLWFKWAAIYFAIGTAWSFIKWFSYLHKVKDELRKHKENFVHKYKIVLRDNGTLQDTDFGQFAEYLIAMRYSPLKGFGALSNVTRADVIPTVSGRFSDLTRWVIWWPFSAFWTLLNDPIRRLAEFIVKRFRKAYEGLASSVFKNEV